MLKIIGGIIIIVTCGLLGLSIAQKYRARISQLRKLNTGLKMLETEITFAATPLYIAMEKIGKQITGPVGLFFLRMGDELQKNAGKGAASAWERALAELEKKGSLQPEDIDIIKFLGPMLGISGVSDQVKNLELTRQLLDQQLETAVDINNRQGKMWQTLGFLLGITLVLLLY